MSKWKEWSGGKQPFPDDQVVTVRLRDGGMAKCKAGYVFWQHNYGDKNIVAYCVENDLNITAAVVLGDVREKFISHAKACGLNTSDKDIDHHTDEFEDVNVDTLWLFIKQQIKGAEK